MTAKKVQPVRQLRITWVKSAIGHRRDQRATIRALGLHRLHESVVQDDSAVIRGMVFKVRHLLQVEEVEA